MEKKIYKYARISTTGQNEARQVEGLKKYKGELLIDKISGFTIFSERPEAKKIIEAVDRGLLSDLIVYEVDRLGRDTADILHTLNFLKEKKVCVTVHKMGLKSLVEGKPSQPFELITMLLAVLAQQEVEKTKERQAEGIAQAKQRGVYKGRKKGSKNKDFASKVEKYPDVKACLDSGMSISKTVIATKISESTVKRIRKEYFESINRIK